MLIDPTDPLKPYVTLTRGHLISDKRDIAAEGTERISTSTKSIVCELQLRPPLLFKSEILKLPVMAGGWPGLI
jgi:hypothetical protein